MRVNRNGGLIVPAEEEANESVLGAGAALVALFAAAIGAARYWAELGLMWGWIALGVGACACGVAVLRLSMGRLREFGDIVSALGALVLGGAAIAGVFAVFAPIAPPIGIGVWLAGWITRNVLFDP